ncbi:MarR family winged helix-turn-helix transcriptional regulator [Brevundimonas diminuta]|uniref:MarR family winged helix-turn-helix transcriptional regulator n=1 Tax=Brevundimonas diminuta TaxID=293 RepID=UPI0018DF5920|nr:MarR family transcriptional regulator [Brevundimonas diminuta]
MDALYKAEGLDFRPRYTPVLRILFQTGPCRIADLSERTGLSHSALSQTVSQMAREGWVVLAPGRDRRERIVSAAPRAREAHALLNKLWAQTARAAEGLDAVLPCPLEPVLAAALEALTQRSFSQRLRDAAGTPDSVPPSGLTTVDESEAGAKP